MVHILKIYIYRVPDESIHFCEDIMVWIYQWIYNGYITHSRNFSLTCTCIILTANPTSTGGQDEPDKPTT